MKIQNIRHLMLAGTAALLAAPLVVLAQHAGHDHKVTPEQFAELRSKIALYRELTDQEILDNMKRMGPNFYELLSGPDVKGDIGVLALGHGYRDDGNKKFANAYSGIAASTPTAMALGMAMMTSDHIQDAVDDLTAAGAKKIVVMPITTLRDGGLTGQWNYIFDERDEAPWMSVARVDTQASTIMTETPGPGPEISAILLSNAKIISSNPANEVVALLAHGPDNEPSNIKELAVLAEHAEHIKTNGGFADVRGFTLQDDAPSAIRKANVDRIREWIKAADDNGKTVIVTTTLLFEGAVHEKLRTDLAGLNYKLNSVGVLENPLFIDWVNAQIMAAGNTATPNQQQP